MYIFRFFLWFDLESVMVDLILIVMSWFIQLFDVGKLLNKFFFIENVQEKIYSILFFDFLLFLRMNVWKLNFMISIDIFWICE